MTYTKFSVNADSKKRYEKSKTNVFFDITAHETLKGSRRKRRKSFYGTTLPRRKRHHGFFARMASFVFKLSCFFAFCAVICIALLAITGIIRVEDGTLFVETDYDAIKQAVTSVFSWKNSGEHDADSFLPSFNTVSSYYMKLRPNNADDDGENSDTVFASSVSDIPPEENARPVDNSGTLVTSDGKNTFPLLSLDLSGNGNYIDGGIKPDLVRINNETPYSVNIENSLQNPFPISPIVPFENMESPQVLIIHTHGTESFTSHDGASYSKSEASPRSTDTDENVVGLGKQLATALNNFGIPTVHCDIMHDETSYLTAYKSAADTIEKYLAEYPDIRYVLDLHRDSIVKNDNTKIKPISLICGEKTAQIMFVVGTDSGGAKHDNWRTNLDVALHLQQRIASDYPTLVRPINLRSSRFNGQYTPGSLIVEVGSCGNTYEEAKSAIKLFAGAFFRAVTR